MYRKTVENKIYLVILLKCFVKNVVGHYISMLHMKVNLYNVTIGQNLKLI